MREPFQARHLPVRTVSGYQAVVDYLRREISLGRLRTGDRLPSERKFAEQLGVARETLRQALRILESSGQVSIQRGAAGGPIVNEAIVDPRIVRADVLSRADSILVLAEFRSVIESGAARMAAQNRSTEDLAAMTESQRQLQEATTIIESRHADTSFHLAIARAAGNPMLTNAIEDARAGMFDLVDLLGFRFLRESSFDAHQAILDAIDRSDQQSAAEAMAVHLSATRVEFERLMDEQVTRYGEA
jgi:GntR family transcriptional repressor for pyruvate dehydrogenase complex